MKRTECNREFEKRIFSTRSTTDQVHLESTLSSVAGEAAAARDTELLDQHLELL